MIPRARVRAPLWRRLLAWLRARRITATCSFCARFSNLPPSIVKMLHESHLYASHVEELLRHEAASMPKPGDGSPRRG